MYDWLYTQSYSCMSSLSLSLSLSLSVCTPISNTSWPWDDWLGWRSACFFGVYPMRARKSVSTSYPPSSPAESICNLQKSISHGLMCHSLPTLGTTHPTCICICPPHRKKMKPLCPLDSFASINYYFLLLSLHLPINYIIK